MDGAVEATLDKLAQIVNKAAPNYKPPGAATEALRDRLRSLFVPPASSSSTSATA